MAPEEKFSPKFGQLALYAFTVSNPDTNVTNTDLKLSSTINSLAVMPAGGSVVGIAVKGNDNVTAGTIAFRAHKSSTEFGDVGYPHPTLTSAAGASNIGYATVRPHVCKFDAGDELGVSYTTATNYAPTTIDFDVQLIVMFDA